LARAEAPGQHLRRRLAVLQDGTQLVHGQAPEGAGRGGADLVVVVVQQVIQQLDEIRGLEGEGALRGHEAQLARHASTPALVDEGVGAGHAQLTLGAGEAGACWSRAGALSLVITLLRLTSPSRPREMPGRSLMVNVMPPALPTERTIWLCAWSFCV